MRVEERDGNVILIEVCDFNVQQIFECGQCFHFKKIDEMEYVTVAFERALHIKQEKDIVTLYNTSMDEYNSIWKKYFDMDTDYGRIKETLESTCDELKEAIQEKSGIRILRQEFTETLLSFIISQNKQIPHIKKIVEEVSRKYGKLVGVINNEEYFSFPDLRVLSMITK